MIIEKNAPYLLLAAIVTTWAGCRDREAVRVCDAIEESLQSQFSEAGAQQMTPSPAPQSDQMAPQPGGQGSGSA